MTEDQIQIRDLLLRAIIGVNDWEREKPQDILLNITLFAELQTAASSDDIEDTVNYRSITKQIITQVESSSRFTVEALAEDVAQICLKDRRVQRVRVRIEKPGALRFARSVGVEIERPVP
jgi:FolB domain-containing protein